MDTEYETLSDAIRSNLDNGRPPLAGLGLKRNDIIWILAHPEILRNSEADFRGCRLDGEDLQNLNLMQIRFGPSDAEASIRGLSLYQTTGHRVLLMNCRLDYANFRGADLTYANLEGSTVEGAVFANSFMKGAIFGHIKLEDGNFAQAILENVDFCDAHLPKANFSETSLAGADFGGANLELADLYNAQLDNAFFGRAQLAQANLCDVHGKRVLMPGAVLTAAKISGAKLPEIILRHANLEAAQLANSILTKGDLRHAQFLRASLHRADLSSTNCSNADFSSADLQEANFQKSDLRSAIFDASAKLGGATFFQALLHGVQWGNVDLSGTDLRQFNIIGDELEAHGAPLREKAKSYRDAAEAYLNLAATLRNSGLSYTSVKYQYRAALMDQHVSLNEFLVRVLFLAKVNSHQTLNKIARFMRFLAGLRYLIRWLGSFMLDITSGYGSAPWRAVVSYLTIIIIFAASYFVVGKHIGHPLDPLASIVLSVTSFHGRGFATTNLFLSDTLASITAAEAALGTLIELLFIAAFTRRFIGI